MAFACPHNFQNHDPGILFGDHGPAAAQTLRKFYRAIMVIGRRINCPCLEKNVQMVNRLFKCVYGTDMPQEDTDLNQPSNILQLKIENHFLDTCASAAEILHTDFYSKRAKQIMNTFDRVLMIHFQVC